MVTSSTRPSVVRSSAVWAPASGSEVARLRTSLGASNCRRSSSGGNAYQAALACVIDNRPPMTRARAVGLGEWWNRSEVSCSNECRLRSSALIARTATSRLQDSAIARTWRWNHCVGAVSATAMKTRIAGTTCTTPRAATPYRVPTSSRTSSTKYQPKKVDQSAASARVAATSAKAEASRSRPTNPATRRGSARTGRAVTISGVTSRMPSRSAGTHVANLCNAGPLPVAA